MVPHEEAYSHIRNAYHALERAEEAIATAIKHPGKFQIHENPQFREPLEAAKEAVTDVFQHLHHAEHFSEMADYVAEDIAKIKSKARSMMERIKFMQSQNQASSWCKRMVEKEAGIFGNWFMKQIEEALSLAMQEGKGFQPDWIPEYARYVEKGMGNPQLLAQAQAYQSQPRQ